MRPGSFEGHFVIRASTGLDSTIRTLISVDARSVMISLNCKSRNGKHKGRSFGRHRINPDLSSIAFDNPLAQGETDTRPRHVLFSKAFENTEDPFMELRGDPNPVI